MPRNEGRLDRGLRVIAGVALIVWALRGGGSPWGWIGVVPLLTGLIGFCPLYRLIGINTCRASHKR